MGTVAKSEDRSMRRSNASGFRPVEVLVVMAILILLAGAGAVACTKNCARTADAAQDPRTASARRIAAAMKSYLDQHKEGKWPKESSGIKFLLTLNRAKE